MALIQKYWSQLTFILGLAFFSGSFVQRSGTEAQMAVAAAKATELKELIDKLVANEQDHDRNITRLTENVSQLTNIVKVQQDQITELRKGHH